MERMRSTEEVFLEHLRAAERGDVEADLGNYAEDVVLLTGVGILRGHDGVRHSRKLLSRDAPDAAFSYVTRLVDGDVAFLEWEAESEAVRIDDGADAFVLRDGLIRWQTIHYTVSQRPDFRQPITFHPVSTRAH
jgi:hypothetical protein